MPLLSADADQRLRLDRLQTQARVKNHRPALLHHEWVEIEFRDLRKIFDHRADSQQSIFERRDVVDGSAAEAV